MTLTMTKDGDLLIYCNQGQPKEETMKQLSVSGGLQKQLRKLKKDTTYKDGIDILLALSIASNEMTLVIHMFLELSYVDITSQTNKQKESFFDGRKRW